MRVFGRLFAAAVLAVAVSSVAAPAASAAEFTNAITNVTYNTTTPVQGRTIVMTTSFCIPDGAVTGDTFYLDLDPVLVEVTPAFTVTDPVTNEVVANVVSGPIPPAATAPPFRLTFTLTSYAESHRGICGQANVDLTLSATVTPGQPIDLDASDGDTTWSVTVIPTAVNEVPINVPRKSAQFTDFDQGHLETDGVVQWRFTSAVGALDSWTIVDNTLPPGLIFDCASIEVLIGTPDPTLGNRFKLIGPYTGQATPSCTSTSFGMSLGAVPAGQLVQVRITSSLVAPTGPGTRVRFANTANFSTTPTGGQTYTNPSTASVTQLAGDGNAQGDLPVPLVEIVKLDTNGNDADTPEAAAALGLEPGSVGLVYTITNPGQEPLINVEVTDVVVANGTVSGLSCDFSPLGGPATGTTWSGPFLVGTTFTCTASLSGVLAGSVHEDIATVTGVGIFSEITVTDDNPYHATVLTPTTETTPPTETSSTTPPTSTTTSTTSTTVTTTTPTLSKTGANQDTPMMIALGGLLVLVGGGLVALTRPRREIKH